jgi:hypothetical protein
MIATLTKHFYARAAMMLAVMLTAVTAWANTVTLTSETGGVTLHNGDVLTGTGGESTYITIVPGATVTLSDVNISSYSNYYNEFPSLITCQGDATIILAKGTANTFIGGYYLNPCIQVGPANTTLTIKGYGTLELRSFGWGSCIGGRNMQSCGNIVIESGTFDLSTKIDYQGQSLSSYAACIGSSGNGGTCGDITISGGNIRAISSFGAAAIGSGNGGTCGNINITGGTIYAEGTSSRGGAAIGGGRDGGCGNISISGLTSVTAKRYDANVPYSIGPGGGSSTCGTLTLWGQASSYIVGSAFVPEVLAPTDMSFTISFSGNGGTGAMADQSFKSNTPQALTFNGFTNSGKAFKCWSTKADGSGQDFSNGEVVTNLGDVTLYAQWANTDYVVSFDANGGTGTMAGQNFAWNTTQVLNANTFTRKGYFFVEWNTKPDGSGDSYDDKQAVSNLGNVTLYAQWKATVITLTPEFGSHTLVDDYTLTGTGGADTHITIADGATVTLSNVDITNIPNDVSHRWAGITCLGDATIILKGSNAVKGGGHQYPGIFVPEGHTLTIRGSGSLSTSSRGNAPGIGAHYMTNCGNIVIDGGTITATGGIYCAGIGGNEYGNCGNITITENVTSVTATHGNNCSNAIGAGSRSSCGTVTIGGIETGNIAQSPYTYKPSESIVCTVTYDANGGTGTMESQTIVSNIPLRLKPNTFTRQDYLFTEWNTKPDGTGISYADGQDAQSVATAASVTLYALWGKSLKLMSETGYIKLTDGQTLTGTGGCDTHVVIADGATVTLHDVDITAIANDVSHQWAGISCEGDATIVLEGVNNVRGGHSYYPGIYVPVGKTLTIRGDGTLNASSNGQSAGIGAGQDIKCGNIVIEGGVINAVAAGNGAGIGGATGSTCGDITITGGTVTATGILYGAGIGGVSSCGDITITDGVTCVTATAGADCVYSIGNNKGNGTAGTVTIGGAETGCIPQSPFIYNPSDTSGGYTVTFVANGGEGTMDAQEFVSNTPQALNANTFTRTKYGFTGWNTAADGSGYSYSDGQYIINRGNVTLYAQWQLLGITKTIDSNSKKVELVDGDMVTGTGGEKTHVTIADGATVTIHNVNIEDIRNNSNYSWAGITCEGDATIILSGSNAVKGGYHSPGIFVPEGKTLTIRGDGSLTARGKLEAAGIGGYNETPCGNIVIAGGTVTATGGISAAGIGSGPDGSCGNIVISGGTVIATGGNRAAGIGCGYVWSDEPHSCGTITITSGITCVIATIESSSSDNIIGTSCEDCTCGTITIAPELTDVTSEDGITRKLYHSLTLIDDADNGNAIEAKNGRICLTVTLSGRTLYKDGKWNTICLPFSVDLTDEDSPLRGATARTLSDAYIEGNTLHLAFGEAVTELVAGVPYIIKWAEGDNIVNPVFTNAAISTTATTPANSQDGVVSFLGTYDAVSLAANDKSNIYFGSANKLLWPDQDVTLGACRAYFKIGENDAVNAKGITGFVIDFGDDGEIATGINEAAADSSLFTPHSSLSEWHTVDGIRLSGKPSKKGMYIHNGKKVVVE